MSKRALTRYLRRADWPSRQENCVATLSGGIDSTVMVYELISRGYKPLCAYVDYGSKSGPAEMRAAQATCDLLGLTLVVIPFPGYSTLSKSYIPGNTDEYEKRLQFWLGGRNAMLGLMLAVLAAGRRISEVFLGINASDSDGSYLDTDRRFLASLNSVIACSVQWPVTARSIWVEDDVAKPEVIATGNRYGVDWVAQTHSCSSSVGEDGPCMDYFTCNSCSSRYYDFKTLGLADPFNADAN